ncbi:MAG TPA: hypothetical protein VED40_23275 [Azospirillaceae bacterium]|nr:hypothetical protein [Azospirillaceae bacterium]
MPIGAKFLVVNLLKFHPIAIYPEGYSGSMVSGEQAYWDLYIAGIAPIASAAGVRLVHRSRAFSTIAGLPCEEWDEVAIFEWPNVETIIKLSQHTMFTEVSIHRIAATQNLRMVPMVAAAGMLANDLE